MEQPINGVDDMKPIYFNELTLDTIPQQNFMLLRAFCRVFARFNDITEKR